MKISAIAAVGLNWELGKDNKLLWKSKDDLQHFKEYTMGKVLVCGRKTYESMPPLSGRKVICLSSKPTSDIELKQEEDIVVNQYGLINIILREEYPELVVIGGSEVYTQMASVVKELVLTTFLEIDNSADIYFPHNHYKHLLKLPPKPYKTELGINIRKYG